MVLRIFVTDVDRSVAFYEAVLGCTTIERWGPAFAMLEYDRGQIWISGPGTSAANAVSVTGASPSPGGWNRLVACVEDNDAVAAHAVERGGKIRCEKVSGPGGSQILIEDPDGNPIELFVG
ncbi:MAG TPA: VOC family protein [Fimbriimonas sp.]|nr:VOC family protein [Fimbriimonas sp.]